MLGVLPAVVAPVQERHFDDGEVIDSDDGYHHYGPEFAVPASCGMFPDSPVTVVRVFLRSWTHPLGADPGPVLIELNLGTAGVGADVCAEMTPGQARAVAAALLEVAASAEGAGQD